MKSTQYKLLTLIFLGLSTAMCSMIYELLIAQMLGQLTSQLITWQCISIGIYLAGLGIGAWRAETRSRQNSELQFVVIETTLAFLGALLVTFICGMHIIYRTFIYAPLQTNNLRILFFTLTCEIMTLAIGYFAGMEIPIIARIWKYYQTDKLISDTKSSSVILGVSYFGALLGSLLFSLWLYPRFHYVKTSFVAALFSFFSAFLLMVVFRPQLKWKPLIFLFSTGITLYFMIPISEQAYQLALQNYYYGIQLNSIQWTPILLDKVINSPPVHQILTPLQTIDIVYSDTTTDQSLINHHPHIPPYRLYLDQRLQYFSADEHNYHESMVHIPIQISSMKPKKVLILGGGDGLLARELLKYSEIESITLVEIDSTLLDLVADHPHFYQLNHNSLKNPKVHVIRGDAFHFARTTQLSFDAIFADFPWPFQYDLAKLYSREFYTQLSKILNPQGFLTLDFPILNNMEHFESYIGIMQSTLLASGFKKTLVMDLNKESFIFAQREAYPLQFYYQKMDFKINIPIEENLTQLKKIPQLSQSPKESPINSIFKPIILSIVDPRF